MNRAEAKEMTEFGMWAKIDSHIKDLIVDACNAGEFEIDITDIRVSTKDIDRLIKLGYWLRYDGLKPDYSIYISWK
jgi:hypothetical protein